jgi:hypothetical protein
MHSRGIGTNMSTRVSIDRSAQPLLAELATSKENPRIIQG